MPPLFTRGGPFNSPRLSGVGMLLMLLIVAAGFVVFSLISSFSGPRSARTSGTLATLPPTSVFAAPSTTAAAWPVAARAVAQSPVGPVAAATATAGKGWELARLHSAAEVPGGSSRSDVQPSWFIDLRGPASADDPSTTPWRTYKVDAAGHVTLVDEGVRPSADSTAVMSPLWPIALERAAQLVLTPTRQQGPIVVRYDCTGGPVPDCAWELRFLRSAAQPTEIDRVYVSADGQKTVVAPPWATPS